MAIVAVVFTLSWGMSRAQDHEHAAGAQEPGQAEAAAGHSHAKAEAHAGVVAMTTAFHFETVFLPDEIRVYAYDAKQNPVALKTSGDNAVKATVEIQFRDAARKAIKLDLKAPDPAKPAMSGMPGMAGMQHMEGMGMGGMNMAGGQDHAATTAHADQPTSATKLAELYFCPMHPDQLLKAMGKCATCGMNLVAQGYLAAKADLKEIKPDEARATFHLTGLPNDKEKEATFTQKIALAKPAAAAHDH
jgi:hypothetical protein